MTVNITNTGAVAGAEVAQLYLSYPKSEAEQPPKHLRGFAKAYLEPGESRVMTMQLVSTSVRFFAGKIRCPSPSRQAHSSSGRRTWPSGMLSSSFGVCRMGDSSCKSVTAQEICLFNTALQCIIRCDAEEQIARLYTTSLSITTVQYAIFCWMQ